MSGAPCQVCRQGGWSLTRSPVPPSTPLAPCSICPPEMERSNALLDTLILKCGATCLIE